MRAIVLGFLVAMVVLAILVYVVGLSEVLTALSAANRFAVVAVFGLSLLWMFAWSYSLHLVLGTLDSDTSVSRSFLVYTNVLFANGVAPFSVLGAEPLAALFVSRATRTSYERGFAAVASVDVLNFLPAPAFAMFGLLYFVVTTTLGKAIEIVILSLLVIFFLLVFGGYVGWRYRERLATKLFRYVVIFEQWLASRLPRVRLPPPELLERQIRTGLESLDRVAADRRTLLLSLTASTFGWMLLSATLWVALWAVGSPVPVEAPLFIVPLVTVTDLVPLPGGVGSVDTALVVLLVATAGVPAASATAAVLVHRAASFLLPIVVGGVAVALVQSS
ncbi:MAG: flippase-like domain-containing protein [Haloarculaceae archaeon]